MIKNGRHVDQLSVSLSKKFGVAARKKTLSALRKVQDTRITLVLDEKNPEHVLMRITDVSRNEEIKAQVKKMRGVASAEYPATRGIF